MAVSIVSRTKKLTITRLTSSMEGGRLLANLFRDIDMFMVPGSSESLVISFCTEYLKKRGKINHLTVSVNLNDYAFHSTRGTKQFIDGDILTLDISYRYKGSWIDMAWSYLIGSADDGKHALYETAFKAVSEALTTVWPGDKVQSAGNAVKPFVERAGCRVIPAGCGHGIGESLHEDPLIPFDLETDKGDNQFPLSGIITLEPVVTTGSGRVLIDPVTGEARTADRHPAAYFETMVFLSPLGVEAPFWKNGNSGKWY